MSDKSRRRELIGAVGRKLIIALLLVSAALLLARTGYYTGLKDLIRGDAAAAETESGAGAETPAVLYSAVRPRTVAVRQSDGTLLASAYDAETTARAFQRFSALLGEALGSAGTPLSLRRTEFQEGLSGSCVLFEMGSALPLGVLSGLLGTRMSSAAQSERAERIYLALRDDRVVLAFRTDTGAYYRCDTAAQAEALRSRIAVAFQRAELYGRTAAENLRWGSPDATDAEVRRAAETAQCAEFLDALPDGWSTVLGEGGRSLSGGQRQRVALARALLKNSEILILDDATSALDLATEAAFYDALAKNYPGTTKIVVAQRIATARCADRIALLSGGTIADVGTHAELLARSALYREICESQEGGEDLG